MAQLLLALLLFGLSCRDCLYCKKFQGGKKSGLSLCIHKEQQQPRALIPATKLSRHLKASLTTSKGSRAAQQTGDCFHVGYVLGLRQWSPAMGRSDHPSVVPRELAHTDLKPHELSLGHELSQ